MTLGPKGRNVVFEKIGGEPQISGDGVTVAKQIELEDPIEDMGVKIIRQAAVKTGETAGDGTTTATILAQALIEEGMKKVEDGENPMEIRKGIFKAVKIITENLKKMSSSIKDDPDKILQVATISANNNPEIGNLISEAVKKSGMEGIITIEEAKGIDTSVEVVEGMQFDKGYLSPYFITDSAKMEVIYEDPYILLYDRKITALQEIVSLLDKVAQSLKPLLVIAEDIEGEALALLVVNKLRGALKVVAVKAPGFGENRTAILEDIAILTGGIVISEEKGSKLESVELDQLGNCSKIIVGKESTTIINGSGKEEKIQNLIEGIKLEIENSESNYEKEKLQKRLAKLSGGVAVIKVGASTEVEMAEKKDRIDDAVNATKAGMEEGIVPGGGVAYIRAMEELDKLAIESEEERSGIFIVKKALEAPIRQIAINSGLNDNEIFQKVKEGKGDFGYNAKTDQYESLLQAGVIDPTKVSRLALENAASVAATMLTTECVIVNKRERKRDLDNERFSEIF